MAPDTPEFWNHIWRSMDDSPSGPDDVLVTQVMGLLRLAPEIQGNILAMPDMIRRPTITGRALRPITQLDGSRQQVAMFQELLQSRRS